MYYRKIGNFTFCPVGWIDASPDSGITSVIFCKLSLSKNGETEQVLLKFTKISPGQSWLSSTYIKFFSLILQLNVIINIINIMSIKIIYYTHLSVKRFSLMPLDRCKVL